MKFIDSMGLAIHIFSRNRLRTLLTVLAVAIGIGVIVFLISLGYGLQQLTVERIAGAESLLSIDVTSADSSRPLNSVAQDDIKAIPEVAQVDPVARLSGLIKSPSAENEFLDVEVWGVAPNFIDLEGLSFQIGGIFEKPTEVVVSTAASELIGINPNDSIGKNVDLRLFPTDSEQGESIKLDHELKVSGVIQDNITPSIYLPRAAIESHIKDTYHSFKVKAASEETVALVEEKIAALGYQTTATIDDVDSLKQGFRAARVILSVFGFVALAISSIGMLNTMTISLLERIKEIGIMKALGASDGDIWLLFLTESSLIGTMGGLSGFILGQIAAIIFNTIFNVISVRAGGPAVDLFATPVWFAAGIVLFSLIVGFMTGVYPARRAARLNPLRALRYE